MEQIAKNKNQQKSFTLVEMIVVVGILGLITGGLLLSMRGILSSELLLKRMQEVEGESRFMMDVFAQDAAYSTINTSSWLAEQNESFNNKLIFSFAEKKSDIENLNDPARVVYSGEANTLIRTYTNTQKDEFKTELNITPLFKDPYFLIKKVRTPDGGENFMVIMSLIFQVSTGTGGTTLLPIETSVMSRTFEF